jgi:hypothetical protein
MSTHPAKKAKLDTLPICPYGISFLFFFTSLFFSLGSNCYRKNPAHFKECSHDEPSTTPKVATTGLLKLISISESFVH